MVCEGFVYYVTIPHQLLQIISDTHDNDITTDSWKKRDVASETEYKRQMVGEDCTFL